MPNVLHLLHTSDLHGQLEAMPYLATVVKQSRVQHPDALLLDAGDWAHGGKISDAFQGKPMIEVMNEIGYDAVGVGEGDVHWGAAAFKERVAEARFPVLAANLLDAAGNPLAASWAIVDKAGTKVGIIGICCKACERPGQTRVSDAHAALQNAVRAVRGEGAEAVIVLSHLGLERDREIALTTRGIHAILGGHSEQPGDPERIGGAVLAQAGQGAQHLGVLTLHLAAEAAL